MSRENPSALEQPKGLPPHTHRSASVPLTIVLCVIALVLIGGLMTLRANATVNRVALAASAKPVTVVYGQRAEFRDTRQYIGTLRPWVEAQVGPQFISAYVNTVLVRPGAKVKRGEVLATLDCRNASASSRAVAAMARAIDARQRAVAHESERFKSLLSSGFVSPNESEMKEATSTSEEAQLAAERAKLVSRGLEVDDCVLRSPFDGEIASRTIDPGAFVRPGTSIVSVVDRTTVRMTIDVPEIDNDATAPGAPVTVRVLATGQEIAGKISRRSPAADPETRTLHAEIDIPDPERSIPVNTTGEVHIAVGEPRPSLAIPLDAAAISGHKATVFVMEKGVAHKQTFKVQGEREGLLFVEPPASAQTIVVTEGRATLDDGDALAAKQVAFNLTPGKEQVQ